MPRIGPKLVQANQRNLDEQGFQAEQYATKLSYGDAQLVTANTNLLMLRDSKKKIGRNSASYIDIQKAIGGLQRAMTATIPASRAEEAFESHKALYQTVVDTCEAYVTSHTTRKRYTRAGEERLQMVRNLLQSATMEQEMYLSNIRDYANYGQGEEQERGLTLIQILAGVSPLTKALPPDLLNGKTVEEILGTDAGSAQSRDQNVLETLKQDETMDGTTRLKVGLLLDSFDRAANRNRDVIAGQLARRIRELLGGEESASAEMVIDYMQNRLQEIGVSEQEWLEKNKGEHTAKMTVSDYRTVEEGVERLEDAVALESYTQFGTLSKREAKAEDAKNPFNYGLEHEHLYGSVKATGEKSDGATSSLGDYGYIQGGGGYGAVNPYLKALNDESSDAYKESKTDKETTVTNEDFAMLRGIGLLDKATKMNRMPSSTRLFRMVNTSFLADTLGIPDGTVPDVDSTGSMEDFAKGAEAINTKAGNIVRSTGFLSAGYAVDSMFATRPIMLTMMCDAGLPVMFTDNHMESEIVFGRNLQMMVLGARTHGRDQGKFLGSMAPKDFEAADKFQELATFSGIEIMIKVLGYG